MKSYIAIWNIWNHCDYKDGYILRRDKPDSHLPRKFVLFASMKAL